MKQEPWLWTEDDLLQLITLAIQESLELDFKRCDSLQKKDKKKDEISKDVGAFANSAGGTIVYGMLEDGHVPTELDIGYDPNDIPKEWLEQVINSRIHRRISGIRVNQVMLNQTNPGRVAYIVHIPQSNQAPHQSSDKRFYKRFNFESVPMEEYEIRDVANRNTAPDLKLNYAFRPGDLETELKVATGKYFHPVNLAAIVSNTSNTVAQHAVFHLYIDNRIIIDSLPDEVKLHDDVEILKLDKIDIELTKLTILWDDHKGLPLFSGITAEIPTLGIQIKIPRNIEFLALRHTIGAPGMGIKDEYTFISIKDNLAKLKKPTIKHKNNA